MPVIFSLFLLSLSFQTAMALPNEAESDLMPIAKEQLSLIRDIYPSRIVAAPSQAETSFERLKKRIGRPAVEGGQAVYLSTYLKLTEVLQAIDRYLFSKKDQLNAKQVQTLETYRTRISQELLAKQLNRPKGLQASYRSEENNKSEQREIYSAFKRWALDADPKSTSEETYTYAVLALLFKNRVNSSTFANLSTLAQNTSYASVVKEAVTMVVNHHSAVNWANRPIPTNEEDASPTVATLEELQSPTNYFQLVINDAVYTLKEEKPELMKLINAANILTGVLLKGSLPYDSKLILPIIRKLETLNDTNALDALIKVLYLEIFRAPVTVTELTKDERLEIWERLDPASIELLSQDKNASRKIRTILAAIRRGDGSGIPAAALCEDFSFAK